MPKRCTWLPVVGLESLYEVSSDGRFRSRDRTIKMRNGVTRRISGVEHRLGTHPNGYQYFKPKMNRVRRARLAHRDVARAFIGPIPDGYHVNHKDGNRSNNRVENLEICSPSHNCRHAQRVLMSNQGSSSFVCKLDEDRVRSMLKDLRSGLMMQTEIADKYGVCLGTVTNIHRKKSWRHITDREKWLSELSS